MMILAKDFIRKYGNNPKYVEGFAAIHKSQLYKDKPDRWHITQINNDEAVLRSYQGDQEVTKRIYFPDFITDWYIGF